MNGGIFMKLITIISRSSWRQWYCHLPRSLGQRSRSQNFLRFAWNDSAD